MSLAKKKKQHELDAVRLAKSGQELKIEEKMEEIERLREAMKVQDEKIAELEKELGEM